MLHKCSRVGYRVTLLILVFYLVIFTPGCSPREKSEPISQSVFKVEVREARTGVISLSLDQSGEIIPGKQAIIIPKTAGMVAAVHLREGDPVARNQVIFQLENTYQELQLQQASSARKTLFRELEELEKLLQAGAVAEFEVRKARAELEQVEITLKMAEYAYENTFIKSPLAGVITELKVQEGELVGTSPVGRVAVLDPVRVRIAVSESHIGRVSEGMAVKLEVPSVGVYRDGSVAYTGRAAIPESRSFLVEVEVRNLSGDLRPGMFARVVLEADTRESLLVSATAVYEKDGVSYLYVPFRGKAVLKQVETGTRQGGMVEIISGLSHGDAYIFRPPAGIKDGSLIEAAGGN